MIEIHEAPPVFEKLIHHNEDKHERVYLTINTFRDVEYLSIENTIKTLTKNGSLVGKEYPCH